MPFHIEEIEQRSFTDWNDLKSYVTEVEEKYTQVPFEDYYSEDAKFSNDMLFGSKGRWIKFNEEAMKTFCKILQLPYHYLEKIKENGLVSNVLNSYLTNSDVNATLCNYQFVLDEQNMTVSGLVSKTCVPYSNLTFLENITKIFPYLIDNYRFEESYIINMNLYLRLLSPTKIGLQLTNNMLGKSSIKAAYFVKCLTGNSSLVLPCTHVSGIVKHTGTPETLLHRIYKNINPVIAKIKDVPEQINVLRSIDFNSEKLVELDGTKFVYSMISLDDREQTERNKLHGTDKVEFDQMKMESYLDRYAKQVFNTMNGNHTSMYDFVSIFTEYAQIQNFRERIRIEEKSGEFANWVLHNKSSFEKLPDSHDLVFQ